MSPLRQLLVVAGLLSMSAGRALACCEPQRVADHEWPCADPLAPCLFTKWLGVDGRGGVYLVGDDGAGGFLRYSHDDGITWSRRALPMTGGASPVGAATSDGRLVIAWIEGTRVVAVTSPDGGPSISPKTTLGDAAPFSPASLGAAVDDSGTAVVAWQAHVGSQELSTWAATSVSAGVSWSAAERVNEAHRGSGIASGLRVAARGSLVLLAWDELDGTVQFDRKDLAGGAFGPDQRIDRSGPSELSRVSGLLVSPDGSVQVAMTSAVTAPGTLHVIASRDLGANWEPLDEPFGVTPHPMDIPMVAPAASRVLALWKGLDQDGPLRSSLSTGSGLPGTWGPVVDRTRALQIEELGAATNLAGHVALVSGDYRLSTAACVDCEGVFLDRSCDAGDTWLPGQIHVDEDVTTRRIHSEFPAVAVSRSGRIHVAWVDFDGDFGDPAGRHAAFDTEPVVESLLVTPGSGCERPQWSLRVHVPLPDGCVPGFQWLMDGTPIAGATQPTHDVPPDAPDGPHEFTCEVTCSGAPLPCGSASLPVTLDLGSAQRPPVGEFAGLLFVTRPGPDLELSWTESAREPQGHHVYSGTLASLWAGRAYDHAALACGIAMQAGGGSLLAPIPAGNTYYLVSSANCSSEGGVGTDSFGSPRPTASAPCGPWP